MRLKKTRICGAIGFVVTLGVFNVYIMMLTREEDPKNAKDPRFIDGNIQRPSGDYGHGDIRRQSDDNGHGGDRRRSDDYGYQRRYDGDKEKLRVRKERQKDQHNEQIKENRKMHIISSKNRMRNRDMEQLYRGYGDAKEEVDEMYRYPDLDRGRDEKPDALYPIEEDPLPVKEDPLPVKEDPLPERSEQSTLVMVQRSLHRAWRLARGTKASDEIRKAISLMNTLLPESAVSSVSKKELGKSPHVCPEKYNGSTSGYPFFYTGFNPTSCAIGKPLTTLISILLDFVGYDLRTIYTIIGDILKNYRTMPIIASCPEQHCESLMKEIPGVKFVKLSEMKNNSVSSIWNRLISYVKTTFVLIARDMATFYPFDARLERLIRVLDEANVHVTSGARRNLADGIWSKGCYQSAIRNGTLTYIEGYDKSVAECIYCDYITAPFVTRTSLIRNYPFSDDMDITGDVLFREFFLSLQEGDYSVVTCPDAMFYTSQLRAPGPEQRQSWLKVAINRQLSLINIDDRTTYRFTCTEANIACDMSGGGVLNPCCLQNLADAIKFFMQTCEEGGSICELQEGTLMGAVKFGKILPWERDADLTFLTANFTAFERYATIPFSRFGMGFYLEAEALWCCVDGIQAGGKGGASYGGWSLELNGQHHMDTEFLRERGIAGTRIHLDGQLVNVPRNPGLYVRNRYGRHTYKHAEHWFHSDQTSGWDAYIPKLFPKCIGDGDRSSKGSLCLDQFYPEGNIQFERNIP